MVLLLAPQPSGDAAVQQWLDLSTQLREFADDGSTPGLLSAIDAYRSAIASFGQADRSLNDQKRAEALGLSDSVARRSARAALGSAHNDDGLHAMQAGIVHIGRFRSDVSKLIHEYGEPHWDDRQTSANAVIDNWRTTLGQAHISPDYIAALDQKMEPGYEVIRTGSSDVYLDYLTQTFRDVASARGSFVISDESQVGQGEIRPYFIPIWKIVAAAVAFGVFIWWFVKCGIFGCSVPETMTYGAITVTAGMVALFC